MRVLILGAGQEVGRSCLVVRMGRHTFMFDCGMHMGYHDARRFPDFSILSPTHDYNSVIDAVFISHFHLDHIGALPFFTEVCGYSGPVYMTYPTRAIAPVMLEDYQHLLSERPGTGPVFGRHHITPCMAKVHMLDLQATVKVCEGVHVTAYCAGHVLGAAVLHVQAGEQSVVYTGDFNTVPDRHLPGASVPKLRPSLLISESTYATSLREGRRTRERQLMALIHETVSAGGKVLLPVSAVGRAQELLLLLDEHWERNQLTVPIYFSGTMGVRASQYYRLLLNWTSERIKQGPLEQAALVQEICNAAIHAGPCVLFATPGMLHGGTSLEVFKAWAPSDRNLVLLPSYQVAGTLGRRLLAGQRKGVAIDSRTTLDVNCKIQRTMGIKCTMPAVGEEVQLIGNDFVAVAASQQLLRRLPMQFGLLSKEGRAPSWGLPAAESAAAMEFKRRNKAANRNNGKVGMLTEEDVKPLHPPPPALIFAVFLTVASAFGIFCRLATTMDTSLVHIQVPESVRQYLYPMQSSLVRSTVAASQLPYCPNPCYTLDPTQRDGCSTRPQHKDALPASPFPVSFWLVKTFKTGSSTLAGVFRSISSHYGIVPISEQATRPESMTNVTVLAEAMKAAKEVSYADNMISIVTHLPYTEPIFEAFRRITVKPPQPL
eukprot:gene5494-5729_t